MKDLIILGNGMAGMTAALYAKRANLDFKIVGKDEFDFGQIGNAILVENFPCAASQSGMDLAMSLHNQLEANDIKIEEHTVNKIMQMSDGIFSIYYEDGIVELTKSIIYALGARHKELNCKIEEGIPIHYCALCDGSLYKNNNVVVIGGGDVAFTQAEYLSKICKNVCVLMCDENVTAASSTFDRVSKISNITIKMNFPVGKISRSLNTTSYLYTLYEQSFCEKENGVGKAIRADGIFVAIGMIPNLEPIKFLSVKQSQMGIVATENGETEVSGFYVAGDVRMKNVRQGLTAAADGANAVNSVINYLKIQK